MGHAAKNSCAAHEGEAGAHLVNKIAHNNGYSTRGTGKGGTATIPNTAASGSVGMIASDLSPLVRRKPGSLVQRQDLFAVTCAQNSRSTQSIALQVPSKRYYHVPLSSLPPISPGGPHISDFDEDSWHARRLGDAARTAGQLSAAITGEVKRGELMRFYVKQVESSHVNDEFSRMTNEELEAFIRNGVANFDASRRANVRGG